MCLLKTGAVVYKEGAEKKLDLVTERSFVRKETWTYAGLPRVANTFYDETK